MIQTCHDGEEERMRKQTLFSGKSQHLGQQEQVLGHGTGTRVLLRNVVRVWLRETRISLSPPFAKSPDLTPATGRKMSFKEGGNIKQTRFYINCTRAKARQGYLTGVLCTRSQLETKPLSTKKLI